MELRIMDFKPLCVYNVHCDSNTIALCCLLNYSFYTIY